MSLIRRASMELVSVQHGFEYETHDGRLVSIKPNETYFLVSRTNEHWWHVRTKHDAAARPFYIPAQYVKVLPSRGGREALGDSYQFSSFGLGGDKGDTTPVENTGSSRVQIPRGGGDAQESAVSPSHGKVKWTRGDDDSLQPSQSSPACDVTAEEKRPDVLCEVPQRNIEHKLHFSFHSFDLPSIHPWRLHGRPPAWEFINMVDTYAGVWEGQRAKRGLTLRLASLQVEDERVPVPIYVNLAQLRQNPPGSPPCPDPDPDGWEVHVDPASGQEYYYHPATGRTTWDNPLTESPDDPDPDPDPVEESPSPTTSRTPSRFLSTASRPAWTSDWEQLVDESSGLPYFYNAMSGETSWEPPELLSPYPPLMEPMSVHRFHQDGLPPLPEEDYPSEDYPGYHQPDLDEEPPATGPPVSPREYELSHVSRTVIPRASLDRSAPAGWNLNVEHDGTWVFTSERSSEQWVKSVDDLGQTYYYLRDGSKSQWNLPEVGPAMSAQSQEESAEDGDGVFVFKNWRHSVGPAQTSQFQEDGRTVPAHRRTPSEYSSDSSSTGHSPEGQPNVQNLEKAGILNKTKVSENGKKVRKNWAQTWTVLHGGVLTFHKDPKSTAPGTSTKTNQIVPEVTVDLRGAVIGWASKEKSSKKNVLELKSKNGVEFLIQYDTESIISDWHKVLMDTIRQLEYQDPHSEEDDSDVYEKAGSVEREEKLGGSIDRRRSSRPSVYSTTGGETDPRKVRTKLMKFLMKRPTLQSVKEKGYIRDSVFGCHLDALCAQERTTVPSFVEKCIKAVERRGLDIDGLYRVSGNLAVIQKLRCKADQEELDLEDGQWEDVHVLTGALKLFFRELPEPLFPYSHFHHFITAIRLPDYNTKVCCISELVKSLPASNHDTMKLLFGHLRRVIQYGEDNRMTVQNVAIVFGPTLLRPEMESGNIAMHTVFQNQIVEFILNEYERIFLSS
uniref:rho GTPase-activating protein 27 isoform X2 n=1 Tax=Doryrhamphus excisus TaxID=161450 RepID=UPI0025AECBCD|nr:rho GTPase-activating protein 27 isoform X2 [Doryrhamphus excisus]